MEVIEINESEFKDKIKGAKVVIDCYAPWCGPCKMISPIIEEIASESNNCEFYKLNVDEAEEVSQEYSIMSIPTILHFENGKLLNTIVGFKTKDELKELLGE